MAELSVNNLFLTGIVFFFQLELFFSICYNNIIFFTKYLKTSKSHSIITTVSKSYLNFFYLFFLVTLLTIKINLSINLTIIIIFTIFFWLLDKFLYSFTIFSKINTNFYSIVLVLIVGFMGLLAFIKSFLSFFFFIELYSVLYYFAFLTSYSLSNQTLLKYKNGLLLLLWNNFLTTFFLGMGCYFLLTKYGTTDFNELYLLTNYSVYVYIFLVGLAWKLGIPLFHFFKLEIYKYLLRENVFLFSISTTLINLLILYFILSQPFVLNTIYLKNFIIVPVLFSINLVLVNLKISNILYYFAVSSVLTTTTILSLFLI